MTSPVLASKGPGGRWYEIPDPIIEGGWRGPSVTTILTLSGGLQKIVIWLTIAALVLHFIGALKKEDTE